MGKIVLSDKQLVARQFFFCILEVLGLPGPERARKTPEEPEKSPERVPWGGTPGKCPKSESQKSPKGVRTSGFRTLFGLLRLRGALFGDSGLFRDFFRTLPGFRACSGPGDPVPDGADPKVCGPPFRVIFRPSLLGR